MVILTSFPPPEEGIVHRQENTHAHMCTRDLGNGTLYIAESRLSWVSAAGQGFSLEYPSISIHAVSRDLSAFHQECLYLMIEGSIEVANEENGTASSDEEDAQTKISEIRFAPADKGALEVMYQALCDCQILHPDPDDDCISEEDDAYDSGEGGDGGAVPQLTARGRATLEHLENIFDAGGVPAEPGVGNRAALNGQGDSAEGEEPMETGQFDDAPDQ